MNIIEESYKGFLNLPHRTDRLEHMTNQLSRIGLTANRHIGKKPEEYNLNDPKVQVMKNRTPGAIGCHFGQVDIMKTALEQNQHAMVMEDDIVFCEDFNKRMEIVSEFTSGNDWDIVWLGGTVHHDPPWWHKQPHNRELNCKCKLGRDMESTPNKYIIRTYGAFCTYAYIVNINSLEKVIRLLDENVHLSMGIDWEFILLQPQLKTYMFVPGCVKQIDNRSDIGDGDTIFSGFSRLNGTIENSLYWYQNKMEDFNHNNWSWKY